MICVVMKNSIDCAGEVKHYQQLEAIDKSVSESLDAAYKDCKKYGGDKCMRYVFSMSLAGGSSIRSGKEVTEEIAKLKCDCLNKGNVDADGICIAHGKEWDFYKR